MKSSTFFQPFFEVNGVEVEFKERVFFIKTQDDELFNMVCEYLESEGFIEECIELYGDDWGLEQIF